MYSTNFDPSKVSLKEIETLVKWLQDKTGGVKIPARFLKLAEQADAEIKALKKSVAVETKKAKPS